MQKKLTFRETQVINLCSQGLSYKQIARELNISRYTINHYSQNIIRKIGGNNMTNCVAIFLKKYPENEPPN